MTTPTRSTEVLAILANHRVEFIVVGVTAAVLQGHRWSPSISISCTRAARKTSAGSSLRWTSWKRYSAIRPAAASLPPSLTSNRRSTRLGPLDVLGTLDEATTYETLVRDAITLEIEGRDIRVLGLERLIAEKERTGRPKDIAVLPVLRATLARLRERAK